MVLAMCSCSQTEYQQQSDYSSTNEAVVELLKLTDASAKKNEFEEARSYLERALRLEPENPIIWFKLAQLSQQQGNFTEAKDLAIRAKSFAAQESKLAENIRDFLQNQ